MSWIYLLETGASLNSSLCITGSWNYHMDVISYMLLMVVCQESVIRESGIRPEISTPKERLRGLAPNHEIGNIRSLILPFLSFPSQTSRPKPTIYVITWSVSEWERFRHHMIYVISEPERCELYKDQTRYMWVREGGRWKASLIYVISYMYE